jgi:predicted nucleic acid-binding protein
LKVYFDTNVLIAALVQGHPHHAPAKSELTRVSKGLVRGFVSSHGIAELYSVLTRAPFVPRILPVEAWKLIDTSVLPHFVLEEISALEYRRVLERCSTGGVVGGRVFDALHVEAARKAGCERLLTFNLRDFLALSDGPDGWIAAPSA